MIVNKRIVSLVVAGTLLGGSVAETNCYAAVKSSRKEEVVYANLAENGDTKGAYVVNIFKDKEIVDYGNYESITNMNTSDILNYKDGEITGSNSAERLYYEGILQQTELPWKIHISYTLDGKEYSADEIAGKSGKLVIHLSIRKNENVKADFFEHYAVQATFKLDTALCKNIEAEGATVANAGAKKQLTYTILPGKGKEIEIKSDVTDFEMDAVTINGVRMQIGLDKEMVDTDSLTNEVSKIQDAVNTLDEGAHNLNEGAGNLYKGLQTLSDGSEGIGNGLNKLSQNSDVLTSGSKKFNNGLNKVNNSLTGGFKKIKKTVSSFDNSLKKAGVKNAEEFAAKQREAAQSITITNTQKKLYQAYATGGKEGVLKELKNLVEKQDKEAVGLYNQMQAADSSVLVNYVSNAGKLIGIQNMLKADAAYIKGSSKLINSMTESVGQVKEAVNTLTDNYNKIDSGIKKYTGGVKNIENGYEKFSSGVSSILTGANNLYKGTSSLTKGTGKFAKESGGMKDKVNDQIDDMIEQYSDKDYKPVSFVSEKNTNVDSVQFVLQIPKIEKEEKEISKKETEKEKNLWQKFTALFGF